MIRVEQGKARNGWYRAVHVKDSGSHLDRAHLRVREQLVKSPTGLLNQLRGLLKLFGLRLGQVTTPAKRSQRVERLLDQIPALRPALMPLLEALTALEGEMAKLDKSLKARARKDPVTRRLMTVPGVGPVTAMVYKSAIRAALPGRPMSAPMPGLCPGAISRASATSPGASPRPETACFAMPSTRPPTRCSPGSSATAPSRPGALPRKCLGYKTPQEVMAARLGGAIG